ncbi:MAG: hypothetical protein EAZ97_00765 [Bacteroidetes bacterium]|nr:MAG: hypothetical protein EAZ97_00765 [Bacteroidota bacterium]
MNTLEDMSKSEVLHQQAMEYYDNAYYGEIKGKLSPELVLENYRKAFELEKQAALELLTLKADSLTRAVIFRSAASIASRIGEWRECEKLACMGLCAEPPKYVEKQLRELLKDAILELEKIEETRLAKLKSEEETSENTMF